LFNVDDSDTKKIFECLTDCGKDVMIGGIAGATVGHLMEVGCATLGSATAESTTKAISKATDKTVGKIAGD